MRWRPGHWLLVGDDGRITGVQAEAPGPEWPREDYRGRLLLPGFIDTHVHSPQLDVIASYGTELLDWLHTYTFPAERAWVDPAVAAAGSALFLDALLAHGTTAAVVFPTVHKGSADALFEAASQRGMRIIAGKVLMDRHAPDGLRDDVAGAERDCIDLIQRWHGRGRNAYAVTVRFAPPARPSNWRWPARCATPTPRCICRRTWPRTVTRCAGWPSCFRRHAAISTCMPAPACCTRARCWRTASG